MRAHLTHFSEHDVMQLFIAAFFFCIRNLCLHLQPFAAPQPPDDDDADGDVWQFYKHVVAAASLQPCATSATEVGVFLPNRAHACAMLLSFALFGMVELLFPAASLFAPYLRYHGPWTA